MNTLTLLLCLAGAALFATSLLRALVVRRQPAGQLPIMRVDASSPAVGAPRTPAAVTAGRGARTDRW